MTNEFDFDSVELIEIPVKYDGVDYLLIEASGEVSQRFHNMAIKCAKFGPDGSIVGYEGVGDVEPALVAGCLVTTEGRKSVQVNTVRPWRSRVLRKLFDKAKEISELDEEDDLQSLLKQRKELDERIAKIKEDMVKNEQNGTTDGSD